MPTFLNVLIQNLISGPATDPFPFGETFTPKRLRGRIKVDPDLCLGCSMCRHVCAAGAINLQRDAKGWTITIWQDSCCLCRSCVTYCPMNAMSIDPDWHSAHVEAEKFDRIEQHTVHYEPCARCGTPMRVMALEKAKVLYAHDADVDPDEIRHLCRSCRQIRDAENSTVCMLRTDTTTASKLQNAQTEAAVKAAVEAHAQAAV